MIFPRVVRFALPILALSALTWPIPRHAAQAQVSFGGAPTGGPANSGADAGGSPEDAEAKATAAANAPPPALPGAVSADPDAPVGHAALDLNPNAALFDAINRGDLTAAKDALSRGADLQSTNILGEKPIEMSIDLSRNDITFLLLSMRNAGENPGSGGAAGGTELAASAGSQKGAGRLDRLTIRPHGSGTVQQAAFHDNPVAQSGGVAKPEIGFLGFGGS